MKADRELDRAIKAFCSTYFEGVDDNGYGYDAQETEVIRRDYDGDGDLDALVAITSCEATNCHRTTRGTDAVSMLNDGSRFTEAGVHKLSGAGTIRRATANGAIFTTTSYGPDDPGCCPTFTKQESVVFGKK